MVNLEGYEEDEGVRREGKTLPSGGQGAATAVWTYWHTLHPVFMRHKEICYLFEELSKALLYRIAYQTWVLAVKKYKIYNDLKPREVYPVMPCI